MYKTTGSAFGPFEYKRAKVVISGPPRLALIEKAIREHFNMPDRRACEVLSVTQWPDAFFDSQIDEVVYAEAPEQ